MELRTVDTLCFVCLLAVSTSAMRLNLSPLWLSSRHREFGAPQHKRTEDGNHCPSDMPFPCKTSSKCIPMDYMCDGNVDCDDGYDEDKEVCTAAHRPAVDQIEEFLESQADWIGHKLFNDKNSRKVAHALAVSKTVDDFKNKLGLPSVQNLKKALHAVQDGSEEVLTDLGMPANAWAEVDYIFSKLVKSGFLN